MLFFPRKLYVFISMAVCLFVCCLILFFLFPRSVTLSPVSVQSVMVYFRPDTVDLNITVSRTDAVLMKELRLMRSEHPDGNILNQ